MYGLMYITYGSIIGETIENLFYLNNNELKRRYVGNILGSTIGYMLFKYVNYLDYKLIPIYINKLERLFYKRTRLNNRKPIYTQ